MYSLLQMLGQVQSSQMVQMQSCRCSHSSWERAQDLSDTVWVSSHHSCNQWALIVWEWAEVVWKEFCLGAWTPVREYITGIITIIQKVTITPYLAHQLLHFTVTVTTILQTKPSHLICFTFCKLWSHRDVILTKGSISVWFPVEGGVWDFAC